MVSTFGRFCAQCGWPVAPQLPGWLEEAARDNPIFYAAIRAYRAGVMNYREMLETGVQYLLQSNEEYKRIAIVTAQRSIQPLVLT